MRIPTSLLWAAAIGAAACLAVALAPTYAFADEPYEEEAYSYKDTVPQKYEDKWQRRKYQAHYYKPEYQKPKRQRYIGEEGQPLYQVYEIKRMCLRLGNEGQQGTMTWYDLDYKRWVCDFGQGYYELNRYRR